MFFFLVKKKRNRYAHDKFTVNVLSTGDMANSNVILIYLLLLISLLSTKFIDLSFSSNLIR